jgi:hypothetical protein
MEQNAKGNEGIFGRKKEQNTKITEGFVEGKNSQTPEELKVLWKEERAKH